MRGGPNRGRILHLLPPLSQSRSLGIKVAQVDVFCCNPYANFFTGFSNFLNVFDQLCTQRPPSNIPITLDRWAVIMTGTDREVSAFDLRHGNNTCCLTAPRITDDLDDQGLPFMYRPRPTEERRFTTTDVDERGAHALFDLQHPAKIDAALSARIGKTRQMQTTKAPGLIEKRSACLSR